MPKQDTRSSVARKVNFAIQLRREAAGLLEIAEIPTTPQRTRYTQRFQKRDE